MQHIYIVKIGGERASEHTFGCLGHAELFSAERFFEIKHIKTSFKTHEQKLTYLKIFPGKFRITGLSLPRLENNSTDSHLINVLDFVECH